MKGFRRELALMLSLMLALTGCGGGGGVTTPSSPTPRPSVQTLIEQGSQSDIGVLVVLFIPFTTTSTGTLTLNVDWTFPDDAIQILVSRGTCTIAQINGASGCDFIGMSPLSPTPKPKTLTIQNVGAGSYTLYIGNTGPKVEAVSWQVFLTTTTSTTTNASARTGLDAPMHAILPMHAIEMIPAR
jgi:hypothetical protein